MLISAALSDGGTMDSGEGLGRPPILNTTAHFASVSIALVANDIKAALVVKAVLDSLGCRRVILEREGADLLHRNATDGIDILVLDNAQRPDAAVQTVRELRCSNSFL